MQRKASLQRASRSSENLHPTSSRMNYLVIVRGFVLLAKKGTGLKKQVFENVLDRLFLDEVEKIVTTGDV